MKAVWFACMCVVLIACQGNTQEKVQLKTTKDSVSYGIGMDIGKNLKMQDIDINPDAIARGIKDASDSLHALLDDKTCQSIMARFRNDMVVKQQQKSKTMGEKGKKEGEAFLTVNKMKPGVKTTASGLQYKVVKEGKGAKPTAGQTVTVNYRGTLVDGTEFDSSYKHGEPATFGLGQMIKGWSEGLQLMTPGSKYEFYIPADLAWGDQSPTPTIPPGSTVIFEVELISIK